MSVEATLTDIVTRLRERRFPGTCHSEPVEESLSFSVRVRHHRSALVPHFFRRTARKEYRNRRARDLLLPRLVSGQVELSGAAL